MAKFRKRPVVIEAVKWDGTNGVFNELAGMGMPYADYETHADGTYENLRIKTLEGPLRASIGDWIIKGVKGEFYPCKPDIFEAIYEAVE